MYLKYILCVWVSSLARVKQGYPHVLKVMAFWPIDIAGHGLQRRGVRAMARVEFQCVEPPSRFLSKDQWIIGHYDTGACWHPPPTFNDMGRDIDISQCVAFESRDNKLL